MFYIVEVIVVILRIEKKILNDTISTEQYCIHNGGYLNAESNYLEFKELLDNK